MQSADLAWIYGAALNASSSEESAADAARAAFGKSPGRSRRDLMASAVSHALERSPAEPLDSLPPPERVVIGLARIVGMDVDEIAAFTGCAAGEVKASMRSGLGRLTRHPAVGAV